MWWKSFCNVSCEVSMGTALGFIVVAAAAVAIGLNIPALATVTAVGGVLTGEGALALVAVGSGITYLCTRNNKQIEEPLVETDGINIKGIREDEKMADKDNDSLFSSKAMYEKLMVMENRVDELELESKNKGKEYLELKKSQNNLAVNVVKRFDSQDGVNANQEERVSKLESERNTNTFFNGRTAPQPLNDDVIETPAAAAGLRNRAFIQRIDSK